jgi:hypothetical protein
MNAPDAEMGLVMTQTLAQQDAGGYNWGSGGIANYHPDPPDQPGFSANGPMPPENLWAFQMNQYELPYVDSSKRLAWGTQYGAVGQPTYTAVDGTQHVGRPHFNYAVFVVLGRKSETATLRMVQHVERIQQTSLSAEVGTVRTHGPIGPGRTQLLEYDPVGYNQIYSTWEVEAAESQATVTLATPAAGITNPIVVVHDYTASSAPVVLINGKSKPHFVSFDSENDQVWVTLFGQFAGETTVQITPDN